MAVAADLADVAAMSPTVGSRWMLVRDGHQVTSGVITDTPDYGPAAELDQPIRWGDRIVFCEDPRFDVTVEVNGPTGSVLHWAQGGWNCRYTFSALRHYQPRLLDV